MLHSVLSACRHNQEQEKDTGGGERGREGETEPCRVSPTKVKLQYSNLIKSIREFPVRGQPSCCAHRLVMSIMFGVM